MKRKLYCFSHKEFDDLMESLNWENRPDNGYSTISICSDKDDNPNHWFNIELANNINMDFDDISPEMWWTVDHYDDYDNSYFNYSFSGLDFHSMDYDDAKKLVDYIDDRIKMGDSIYVHCSAGKSRSQAIVRYILDTYPDIDWKIRKDNPPLTPNIHVLRMLKRAYIKKFINEYMNI